MCGIGDRPKNALSSKQKGYHLFFFFCEKRGRVFALFWGDETSLLSIRGRKVDRFRARDLKGERAGGRRARFSGAQSVCTHERERERERESLLRGFSLDLCAGGSSATRRSPCLASWTCPRWRAVPRCERRASTPRSSAKLCSAHKSTTASLLESVTVVAPHAHTLSLRAHANVCVCVRVLKV